MMDAQSVRTALGTLQNNAEAEDAWQALREALTSDGGDLPRGEAIGLLLSAKKRHAKRGEAEAVARLLELCIELCDEPAQKVELLSDLSEVRLGALFAGHPAILALEQAVELAPEDETLAARLADLRARAETYKQTAASYQAEAEAATDDAYRSAMLMRACEAEVSFAEKPKVSTLGEDLEMALRLDSTNLTASRILEVIYRRVGDDEGLIRVLERTADRAPDPSARIAAGVRLARHYQHVLEDEDKAAAVFDRVLESDSSHPDALRFVIEHYSKKERWDALVRVYERQLKNAETDAERLGDMLQVAMLHWKMRGVMADAEPWFAKIRAVQPAHEGMLAFYREYKAQLNDDVGLAEVLEGARASLGDEAPERAAIEAELGAHASAQADAHREIEKWKAALRENPDDEAARDRLKVLYKQTQGHNALVELLRQQLERTPEGETETRVAVLRQIAAVYREYVKSETALVGVLNQIVQLDGRLDEQDVDEVRELVALYDRLGRPRDLLASQKLLAEIVPDLEEKKLLYRQVGRRWLDQFSNVQHAMEAFAALHELDPSDEEAIERLEDLYRKRRAWKELYALYEQQLAGKEGPARIPLLREMAQLAGERLSRVPDALAFYQQILDIDGTRAEVLDRYEKHAERAKDWAALADALERRLANMPEDETRLPVLQKLGGVYAEHLDRPDDAIGTWRRVVQVQPGNPRAMRVLRDAYLKSGAYGELEALYVEHDDLEGLAEVLSTAADRATDAQAKIDLSYRAARVYEEGLEQSGRAIRSYERILSIDPGDLRAIDRLLPLYENDDKWVRVPPLLEVKLEKAESKEQKIEVLEQLVIVAAQRLLDRRGAVHYARRAYELYPEDQRTMELLDSASRSGGGWDEMVSALEQRLTGLGVDLHALARQAQRLSAPPPGDSTEAASKEPAGAASKKRRRRRRKGQQASSPPSEVADPAVPEPAAQLTERISDPPDDAVSDEIRLERRAVSLRLARILGEELARVDEAIARLKVLMQDNASAGLAEDEEVFSLLEGLLRRQSKPEDIRWLFSHREGRAGDPEARARILSEWAAFEERDGGDSRAALALYQRVLTLSPESEPALEAVSRLASELALPEVALAALERHRDLLHGDDRAKKEVALAAQYEMLARAPDALAAIERALASGIESGLAIPVLQKLVEIQEVRADAARILSEQYEAGGDARKEADALRALIAETSEPAERAELVLRLAAVYQQKLAEPGSALGVITEGLRKSAEDMSLWDRADELAAASGRIIELADTYRELVSDKLPPDVRVDLCRRAGRLHEELLADSVGAAPYYEKILAAQPDDEDAFLRLKEILTASERWQELDKLYEKEISRIEDGTRRLEMLAEVALLAEDITGDVRRAVDYHTRILELDPEYAASLDALDRLYSRLGEKAVLLDLLDRRAEVQVGEERILSLLRIGQLALELHQPDRTMSAVEKVLLEDLTNYEARDLAEKLLEIGSVRLRAARSLEAVFESRDEIRDLVRVLSVRLDALRPKEDEPQDGSDAHDDERRELLRRIATLRDDRLHDDVGSFDVFAELVPLDPEDVELRDRLMDSGRRLGRNQRVVEVLLVAANAAEGAALTAEILLQAAELQADALEDLEAAETTLRAVLPYESEEPDAVLIAARLLESILVRGTRREDLVENLRLQIRLEPDAERKAELLARVAQLSMEFLGDTDGAISAWEERLREIPDDTEALQNLGELYEKSERYLDLKRVLIQRRDTTLDNHRRMSIVRHLADLEERHLDSPDAAIESYQTILDEGGGDASTLRALIRLYTKAERHEELCETLLRQADTVEDRTEELAALAQLGQVRAEKLGDVPGALEAFRRALALDDGHRASLAALRGLLEHEDPLARLDAGAILEPIYEAAARAEDLFQVLSVQARSTDDPAFKVELLRRASDLAEQALDDSSRAFDAALRGLRAAAALGDVHEWLARVDRLATMPGGRARQVELLTEVIPELFDVDQQVLAQRRVAEIKRHDLEDLPGAVEAYKKALELQPDDEASLLSLEAIYQDQRDYGALLGILEQREEAAPDDASRKALAYRRAELLADRLDEPGRAIETYEAILDLSLESPAIEAVSALYLGEERYDDLVALLQRRIDEADRKGDLRVQLVRILVDKLREPERAVDELEQTLLADPQHPGAVACLEELAASLGDGPLKAKVASLLEPVYMARADYDSVLRALLIRLAGSEDPIERRDLVQRIAKIHEEQQEDYVAALEVMAQLLVDDTSDPDTVDEMERLAKVAGAEHRLAELFEAAVLRSEVDDEGTMRLASRAGQVFAEGDGPEDERALLLLRRALRFEPENRKLFQLVDRLLTRSGTTEELVELYRTALEHRFDPDEQVSLLHQIADLSKNDLKDPDSAIDAHQRVLDLDDQNVRSLDELTLLYASEKRYVDLAELYLRRAESVEPGEAVKYRLALAALYKNRLDQPEAALDQLEEITRDFPQHVDAISRIEAFRSSEELRPRAVEILRPLYEDADDWRKLIALGEDRFDLSEDAHERVQILRESAELWELRGEDAERAFQVLVQALRIVPDDEQTRLDIERLVVSTAEWRLLADLYEEILAANQDVSCRQEMQAKLVEVYDTQLDEPRRALRAAQALLDTDDTDPDAIAQTLRLATLLGDWTALERALVLASEGTFEPGEQIALLLRLGELRHLTLDDTAGATAAYERAHEIDERNPEVTDRLIGMYEATGDKARLTDLYLLRVEFDDASDDLRFALFRKAATLLEKDLGDGPRAIECLSNALIAYPGDASTIAELNRLYRVEEMWAELLDNLRLEAGTADSTEKRLAIRHEIALILAEKLESFDEAIEAYGVVLDERPDDEVALDAVFAICEREPHLMQTAADLLVPALRQTGLYSRLIAALELRLQTEQDPAARVETLKSIAQIQERELEDETAALGAILRAARETPEAWSLYDQVERLAELTGAWKAAAEALENQAGEIFDAEVAAGLWVRAAKTREERLSQRKKAIENYQRATEQVGDRIELLDALDRLYSAEGDTKAVVDLLDRRMALADSDAAQARILTRQAQLQLEKQKQPAEAISSLRQALQRDLNSVEATAMLQALLEKKAHFEEVFEILDGVYRDRRAGGELAALHQKRVDAARTPEERLEMRRSLSEVLEHDCGDPLAAQRVLAQALADDVSDVSLQDEIERLASFSGAWEEAASALLVAADRAGPGQQEAALELCRRAFLWARDRARDPGVAEQALVRALGLAPEDEDLLEQLDAVQSVPGREVQLLATVRRRANLSAGDQKLELLRRAHDLALHAGDDGAREQVLRDILREEPQDKMALRTLGELRESAGDHQEAYDLLLRQAELEAEPGALRALRVRAAEIARDQLGKRAEATRILGTIFEENPEDPEVADALLAAYAAEERHEERSDLLRQLIDREPDGERRTGLRVELATLRREHLGDVDGATELLELVFSENPEHAQAALSLAEMYEGAGRHAKLCDLLERQVELALASGQTDLALGLQRRLAHLYEAVLEDLTRAVATWNRIRDLEDTLESLEALQRLCLLLGDRAHAAVVLEEICVRLDGAEAIERNIELSHLYAELGDRDASLERLKVAHSLGEADAELSGRLRREYEALDAWPEVAALVVLQAGAATATKTRVDLLREAASVYLERAKDPGQAADVLQKAVDLDPENRELLLDLCDAVSAAGRGEEAVGVLQKIVDSFGGRRSKELGEIHRRLANAYLAQGRRDLALEELDKAFRIEPGNINVLRQLGDVAIESGDMKKAQQMYRALLLQRLDSGSPITKAQVFFKLGLIHKLLGEGPKAKQMFERALQADADLVEAEQELASL